MKIIKGEWITKAGIRVNVKLRDGLNGVCGMGITKDHDMIIKWDSRGKDILKREEYDLVCPSNEYDGINWVVE